MPGAVQTARCLALCVAALLCVGEGTAANPQQQAHLEARPSSVAPLLRRPRTESSHDASDAHRLTHQPLEAIEVHDKATPPETIDTVSHQKLHGSGYSLGSPLYERQEAFRNGSAIASITKTAAEAPPHEPGSPSFMMAAVGLVISVACISGIAMMNERTGKDMPPGAFPAASASSLHSPMTVGPSSHSALHLGQNQPHLSHQHAVLHSQPAQPGTASVPHLDVQQAPLPISSSMAAGGRGSSMHLQAAQVPRPHGHPGSPTHSSPGHATFPGHVHVGSPSQSSMSHGPQGYSPRSGHHMPAHSQSLPPGQLDGGVQILDAQGSPMQPHYGSWQSLPASTHMPQSRHGN